MSQLAENTVPLIPYRTYEETATSEQRRAVENLTRVGSFQGHGVHTIQEETVAPSGTSRYISDIFSRRETTPLGAPLGLTHEPLTLDVIMLPFSGERMIVPASRGPFDVTVMDVRLPPVQGKDLVASLLRDSCLGTEVFSVVQPELLKSQKQKFALDITDEANRRLASHEDVKEKLVSIVKEEASWLNITIKRITVRPGWSHEYEDTTSVVIDVEIEGTDDQRFSLWDAACEKVDRLHDMLPEEQIHFLTNEISIVVVRD